MSPRSADPRPGSWLVLGPCLALAIYVASTAGIGTLTKGQVIKQFHAYGITQSLASASFHPLRTNLPCPDPRTRQSPRPWAEEPPVFHLVAAVFERAGLPPSAIAVTVGVLTSLLVAALWSAWTISLPAAARGLGLLACLTIPVGMRY